MSKMKQFLSYSFLFSFTDDDYFGELKVDSKKIRFSIFRFSFGLTKVYLFTHILRDRKWSFIKIINMFDIQEVATKEESEEKAKKYGQEISGYTDDIVKFHVDALKYKMTQLEDGMTMSFNKAMFYCAVFVGLLTLVITWVINTEFTVMNFLIQLIIGYCLINIWLFLRQFVKVGGWARFGFADFKKSSKPCKQFAESIYYEWYYTRNRVPVYVSCVKNIEKYFSYLTKIGLLIIIIIIGMKFGQWFSSKEYVSHRSFSDANASFNINLSSPLKEILNSENMVALEEIRKCLANNEYAQIIIVRTKEIKNEVYVAIVNQLIFCNVNKTLFTEVLWKDAAGIEKNLLTVIPVRREK